MDVSAADWLAVADPTTILVVDHYGFLREGLCGLLRSQGDMRVVGEAGDSVTAAAVAARQRPDIVLLDIGVPGGDGGKTVSQIQASSPGSRVIVLSMHESARIVREALASGARGYLLKSICWHELVVAIRTVRADGDRVVLGVSRESLVYGAQEDQGPGVLSAREREILTLVGQALSNRQIAARLSLTEAIPVPQHRADARLAHPGQARSIFSRRDCPPGRCALAVDGTVTCAALLAVGVVAVSSQAIASL